MLIKKSKNPNTMLKIIREAGKYLTSYRKKYIELLLLIAENAKLIEKLSLPGADPRRRHLSILSSERRCSHGFTE